MFPLKQNLFVFNKKFFPIPINQMPKYPNFAVVHNLPAPPNSKEACSRGAQGGVEGGAIQGLHRL